MRAPFRSALEVKWKKKHYWWFVFSSFAEEVLLILAIRSIGFLGQETIYQLMVKFFCSLLSLYQVLL